MSEWRGWAVFGWSMAAFWFLFAVSQVGAADLQAELAKYQAEHQKAQQQAAQLQQDMVNTQAVILRLEGAIAALHNLQKSKEKENVGTK